MGFDYKKVLVIGATSGIGKALAEKLVDNGTHVIVVGRRKENLDEFVNKHGKDKAEAIVFDITNFDKISEFARNVADTHPDLDCVFLNSGIQRGFNFAEPENIDLSMIRQEFDTNYISFIYLATAFLPFLQAKKEKTALIFTTSGLALVPLLRCPNYCATKAALHQWILCLREQLKSSDRGNVKVIEIFPPAVQTELHDEKHQPDIKNGRNIGMPLDDFTQETYEGLVAEKDEIPVGGSKDHYNAIEPPRQERFHKMIEAMKNMGK